LNPFSSPSDQRRVEGEALVAVPCLPGKPLRAMFLRKRSWVCWFLLLPFLAACAGSVVLYAVYHWPRVNVFVYYFTVRPALLWFGALVPLLVLGVFALRVRWFLLGCALWFATFCGSYEILQCLKPFSGHARAEFEELRQGFLSFLNYSEEQHSSLQAPLRIVTWNVFAGRRGSAEGLDQLAALDPDMVFFQEYAWDPKTGLSDPRAHPHFARYHLLAGRTAMLSRFPIERVTNKALKPWLGSVYRMELSPGMYVMCVNMHLSTTDLRTQIIRGWSKAGIAEGVERAKRELGKVRQLVDNLRGEGATIVAGDFNLPAGYAGMSVLTKDMQDCFKANGYGWGKTVRSPLIVVRVDLIFVPDDADVRYAAAVPSPYSDHYMTLAEVLLPVRKGSGSVPEAEAE